ncbi:hypothetical protein MANES_15G168450v8 [Manihot esculenta]|uniref:Uncharacterized protein n=1 Tax=Manihot esculenta TaxID=3983 RepID=A0ACB7GBZ6_MANES|nr:hypothetical protein MANES_15G168450v8 [Manihot esculenta]
MRKKEVGGVTRPAAIGFEGGETPCRGGNVNLARTKLPSIWVPSMYIKAFSASALALNSTYPYPLGRLIVWSIASSTCTTSPKLLNISFKWPSCTFLLSEPM